MSFEVGRNFALFFPFHNNLSHFIRKMDGHMYVQAVSHTVNSIHVRPELYMSLSIKNIPAQF